MAQLLVCNGVDIDLLRIIDELCDGNGVWERNESSSTVWALTPMMKQASPDSPQLWDGDVG